MWGFFMNTDFFGGLAPRIDESGLPKPTIFTLELMGHKINEKNLGCQVQAIAVMDDGSLNGVSDPRGEGLAKGY